MLEWLPCCFRVGCLRYTQHGKVLVCKKGKAELRLPAQDPWHPSWQSQAEAGAIRQLPSPSMKLFIHSRRREILVLATGCEHVYALRERMGTLYILQIAQLGLRDNSQVTVHARIT